MRELAIAQGGDQTLVDQQIVEERKYTDRKVGMIIAHEDPEEFVPVLLYRINS